MDNPKDCWTISAGIRFYRTREQPVTLDRQPLKCLKVWQESIAVVDQLAGS